MIYGLFVILLLFFYEAFRGNPVFCCLLVNRDSEMVQLENQKQDFILMDQKLQIWELLSKRSGGELSDKEAAALEKLITLPENQEAIDLYNRVNAYWERVAKAPTSKEQEALWAAHKEKLLNRYLKNDPDDLLKSTKTPEPTPSTEPGELIVTPEIAPRPYVDHQRRYRPVSQWPWKKIAAVLVFTIGLGWFIRQYTEPQKEDVIVQNGEQKHVVLPDGSQVWLNSGSQLSYDKDFLKKNIREVLLSGEAFFDIQHDPKHAFIIHTRYIDIKDIGTRFNVKAYPEDDQVETTLLKGEVEVYRKDEPGKTIHLKPNEKIIFQAKFLKSKEGSSSATKQASGKGSNTNTAIITNNNSGTSNNAGSEVVPDGFFVTHLEPTVHAAAGGIPVITETAWMEHQLIFNAQTFKALAKNMERWYDVSIQFDDAKTAAFVFTGVFKEETLQQALSELQMIQSFRYKRSGKEIRIY